MDCADHCISGYSYSDSAGCYQLHEYLAPWKKDKKKKSDITMWCRFLCFATSFGAKNALCRIWRLLSQVVEEEFELFLGFG